MVKLGEQLGLRRQEPVSISVTEERELTEVERTALTEQLRQKQITTEQEKLNVTIKNYQESVERSKARLRQDISKEERRDIEGKLYESQQVVSYLEQGRGHISKGYTADSVMEWAFTSGHAKLMRMEQRRAPETITETRIVTEPTARELTLAEQRVVSEWVRKYQQTPTPETIREILKEKKARVEFYEKITPKTKVPSEWMFQPTYLTKEEYKQIMMPAIPTTWESIKTEWGRMERAVSERIPVTTEEILAGAKVYEKMEIAKVKFFPTPTTLLFPKIKEEEIKIKKAFAAGYMLELKEKPIKTAALTGAFFVLPPVLGVAGRVVAPVVTKLPTAATILGKAVSYGLPAAYTASVGYRVMKEDGDYEAKVMKFGRITAGEITPMVVGGYAAIKVWPKVTGYLRTLTKKEIATERLVPREVLMGKKMFPEAPRVKHYEIFISKKYALPKAKKPMMFHAAGMKIKLPYVEAGKLRGFPGLYGAPGISPHFLRVTKVPSIKFYGGRLFELYGKPTVYAITPKKFIKGVKAPPGVAFVPAVKPEVEAILPVGTKLIPKAERLFFRWAGVRVPIKEFVVAKGVTPPPSKAMDINTIIKSISRYAARSYAVTTPSAYALGLGISYKPYRPPSIYKPYRPSLVKVPSLPSYVPVKIPSVIPPYKPYKPPVRVPSYIPPYKPPHKAPAYKPYKAPYYPQMLKPYIPPTPPPLLLLPDEVRAKKIKKKLKRRRPLIYLPSPSWMLAGLKPLKVTLPQARKLLRKTWTGAGIRPGVLLVRKKRRRRHKKK